MWGMNRLGPSLVAGAAAAAGLFVIQLGAGRLCSGQGWTALYIVLCTVGFAAAGAVTRRNLFRRFGVATLGAGFVLASWTGFAPEWHRFCGDGMSLLALGLTLVFGGVRSGLFDTPARLNLRRVLGVEGVLGFTALLFAVWLADPAPWGIALSLWGYLLVQSLYACVPRSFLENPKCSPNATDPFDTAFAQLELILGEESS